MPRKPTELEQRLLDLLLRKGGRDTITAYDAGKLLVEDMGDSGMGSLKLFPFGLPVPDRTLGSQISDYMISDTTGVPVLATLYADTSDQIFEIDIWKMDYSKVQRLSF